MLSNQQQPINIQPAFPILALPSLLCTAVCDVAAHTQAPISMIVSSALGALSMSMQNSADVMRPNGLVSPISLFVLTIAESGERKSTVDTFFTNFIREIEKDSAVEYEQATKKYQAAMLDWKVDEKCLIKSRSMAKENQNMNSHSSFEAHLERKPKKPKKVSLIYNNATPAAIKLGMHENCKNIGVFSSEGGVVFDSQAMQDLAMFNDAWGGDPIKVDRVSSTSFVIEDPRVTFSVLIQPIIFQKFMEKKGDQFRGIGSLARMLVSNPVSTIGNRPINIFNMKPSLLNLKHLQAVLKAFLQKNLNEVADGILTRKVIEFSPEAGNHWVDFCNTVESKVSFGQEFWDIRDYASKAGENVARIAALFHLLEGMYSQISLLTLQYAILVELWYMNEFNRLFGFQPKIPQEYADAEALQHWLYEYCQRNNGSPLLKKNDVAQLGPNQLRKCKIRREAALYVLATKNIIQIFTEFSTKTQMIALSTFYFPIIIQPEQFI